MKDILERIDLVLGEDMGAASSSGILIGVSGYGASNLNLSLLNKKRKKKKKKETQENPTIYDIFRQD